MLKNVIVKHVKRVKRELFSNTSESAKFIFDTAHFIGSKSKIFRRIHSGRWIGSSGIHQTSQDKKQEKEKKEREKYILLYDWCLKKFGLEHKIGRAKSAVFKKAKTKVKNLT